MKKEIKEELKKLWAKIKVYLPLIGVIALVCSMILGLFFFARCKEERQVLKASASVSSEDWVQDFAESGLSRMLSMNLATAFHTDIASVQCSEANYLDSGYNCGYIESVTINMGYLESWVYLPLISINDLSNVPLEGNRLFISYYTLGDPSCTPSVTVEGTVCHSSFDYVYSSALGEYVTANYLYFDYMGEGVLSFANYDGVLTLYNFYLGFEEVAVTDKFLNYDYYAITLGSLGFSFDKICPVDHDELYAQGYSAGQNACVGTHSVIIEDAYSTGHADGFESGASQGFSSGYVQGESAGKQVGYDIGYEAGSTDGHEIGYNKGFEDAYDIAYETLRDEVENEVLQDKETFLDGLFSIMDAPMRIIRECFNFEIFGINISELIFFILTAVIVVFVIKKGKGG